MKLRNNAGFVSSFTLPLAIHQISNRSTTSLGLALISSFSNAEFHNELRFYCFRRQLLYLYSAKQCIIRQTEYECIENTSYDATCCIRIIYTIPVYTITNAFKQYKVYSHKSVMNITINFVL